MNVDKKNNFENTEIKGTYIEKNINLKNFYNFTFKGCDFTGSDISGSLFSECLIENSNFRLVKIFETQMHDVYFKECKIMGVDFTQISNSFSSYMIGIPNNI